MDNIRNKRECWAKARLHPEEVPPSDRDDDHGSDDEDDITTAPDHFDFDETGLDVERDKNDPDRIPKPEQPKKQTRALSLH